MRKVLVYCLLLSGFTACRNSIGGMANLKSKVKSSLLHSIFNRVDKNCSVDTIAAEESVRHFNFFLKDGFANKFGL